ncbi:MAG TPA: hypothetical protein VMF58_18855 [Rhizomicrobium sp.]|nr:hypothetical protein [Rhizomicrobium sp.]
MRIATMVLAAALLAAGRASACDYEHARYALAGDPSVVAEFTKPKDHVPEMAGDLFFYIKMKRRKLTYWYFPDRGTEDVTMISMLDPREKDWQPPDPDSRWFRPHPDEPFYAFGDDYRDRFELPSRRQRAAKLLFLPNLAHEAWYGGLDGDNRFDLARGLFVRRCITAK